MINVHGRQEGKQNNYHIVMFFSLSFIEVLDILKKKKKTNISRERFSIFHVRFRVGFHFPFPTFPYAL